MDEFDDIPESLKRDLKAQPRLEIPAARDALIKNDARRTLRGRMSVWRGTALIGSIAAAIAIVLFIGLNGHRGDEGRIVDIGERGGPITRIPKSPPRVNDINGDGTVDIRDALVLAQRLKAKEQTAAPWNPKVTLDQNSLDAIVNQIVAVSAPSAAAPDKAAPEKHVPATFAVIGIDVPTSAQGTVRQ